MYRDGYLADCRLLSSQCKFMLCTKESDNIHCLVETASLDVGASLPFNNKVNGRVSIRNLTNQLFYVSADDRAAFAQGRSIQFALRFLF